MEIRKIETREQKEKTERRRNIIIGLILVTLMVLSTWGYALNQEEKQQTLKYNGFTFTLTENGWEMQKPFHIITRFSPKEVEEIPCNCRMAKDDFANQDVYISASNAEERLAAGEIIRNLPVLRVQLVCLEGEENKTGCEELPIKNCFDDRIIIIKEIRDENYTQPPRAYQQSKCLYVESKYENLTMVSDRVVFSLYGII